MSLDRLRVRDEEVRPSAEHIAQNNRHDFRRRCPRLPHLCRSNRSDCAPSCPGPILSPRSRSRAVGVPLIGPGSVGLVNLDVDSPHPQPPTLSQPAPALFACAAADSRALAFGAGRLCHAIMPSAFGRVDVRLDAFTADAHFQASVRRTQRTRSLFAQVSVLVWPDAPHTHGAVLDHLCIDRHGLDVVARHRTPDALRASAVVHMRGLCSSQGALHTWPGQVSWVLAHRVQRDLHEDLLDVPLHGTVRRQQLLDRSSQDHVRR